MIMILPPTIVHGMVGSLDSLPFQGRKVSVVGAGSNLDGTPAAWCELPARKTCWVGRD